MCVGNKHKIKGLTASAAAAEFEYKNEKITVKHYYSEINKETIKYSNLQCADCSKGKNRKCYIPLEFLKILPGQRTRIVSRQQQDKMIRLAAQKPSDKIAYIRNTLRDKGDISKNEKSSMFGLRPVESNLATVNARILPQPYLRQ